ncbi:MAG: transposase [Actinomycetota bacterium]
MAYAHLLYAGMEAKFTSTLAVPLGGVVSGNRKRPGRPQGAAKLTPEIQAQIVALIRGGVFAYVAAETAGISERTYRDWIARGEDRHSSRSSTPTLRAFAKEVRRAQAEARAVVEARIFREHPRWWLTHVAPTTQDRPGWTEQSANIPTTEDPVEKLKREVDELAKKRQKRRSTQRSGEDSRDAGPTSEDTTGTEGGDR